MIAPHALIFAICIAAIAGVIARPLRWPEAIWAVAGALLLLLLGLIEPSAAWAAVARGWDVYLFLAGMMMLAELARIEGVFDWLARHAASHAKGSQRRLFALVFGVGTLVTIFLSNDATAVVLTPAVYATARRAEASPLPLLFACALIANAASFVLPISNPANLVLYGDAMPPLGTWLATFALPSIAAIAATFVALRLIFRRELKERCSEAIERVALTEGGRIALAGIMATALVLLIASALARPLGPPTAIAGAVTALILILRCGRSRIAAFGSVSWEVLPLVAGLFVLVAAVDSTGAIATLARIVADAATTRPAATALASGAGIAVAGNLMNNLPAGLIAATMIGQGHLPRIVVDALLIGIDLGPNLSITGSLATILWLSAIRREGEDVGFWRFLGIGAIAMPPALILALAALLIQRWPA